MAFRLSPFVVLNLLEVERRASAASFSSSTLTTSHPAGFHVLESSSFPGYLQKLRRFLYGVQEKAFDLVKTFSTIRAWQIFTEFSREQSSSQGRREGRRARRKIGRLATARHFDLRSVSYFVGKYRNGGRFPFRALTVEG